MLPFYFHAEYNSFFFAKIIYKMKEDKSNTNDPTLSVDLSEATQAVKENRFEDALMLFEIILKDS